MFLILVSRPLFLTQVKFQLTTLDSHPTVNDGVLILVIGDLSIDGGPVMKFSHVRFRSAAQKPNIFGFFLQVFHLQKGGAAYFGMLSQA